MGAGIREVARLAGVSPSTVSRVLNDKTDGVRISAKTVARIRGAADTLQYRPNAAARNLRTTRAQSIGVIARNLLQPFIAELLRVISVACRTRGYHLLVGHAEPDSIESGTLLGDIFSPDRVDGVLLLGDLLPEKKRRQAMERLLETHKHVVTVGARPSEAGEYAILVDDEAGVSMALEHVLANGHRSIGFIGQAVGPESWEDTRRRSVYRAFLQDHGLPMNESAVAQVAGTLESIQQALRSMQTSIHPPSALFVANDVTALMTIKAAFTCGLHVPEDLSVVGFDDMQYSALVTPALTTIHQPIDAMGQRAACVLLDLIGGIEPARGPAATTEFFPPTLICRESVGPCTAQPTCAPA